jgi:hypothetical protein
VSRVLAMLAAGLLVVAGLGLWLLRGSDEPARVVAPSAVSLAPGAVDAEDFAQAACVRLRLVEQGIAAESAASTVRRELASARVLAAEALQRDGRWAALSGSVAALDEAVRRDDGATAVQALRVAQQECKAVREP